MKHISLSIINLQTQRNKLHLLFCGQYLKIRKTADKEAFKSVSGKCSKMIIFVSFWTTFEMSELPGGGGGGLCHYLKLAKNQTIMV